jgi:exocyst complex component 7
MPAFPVSVLNTLRQLVSFLRTMPLPSTHPSHPAAPEIYTTLKDAQRGYADMRGVWTRKCLEAQGKRVVDRADTIDGVTAGQEFGRWVELLLSLAEVRFLYYFISTHSLMLYIQDEYQLLLQLSPLSPPTLLATSFATLLAPLLTLFTSTLGALAVLIKKSLHKYTFLALAAYDTLLELQPQWDAVLARRGPDAQGNELKDGLGTLRAVCLRSFPEFLADLKMAAMERGAETTGLADFVINVCASFLSLWMKFIVEFVDDEVSGTTSASAGRSRLGADDTWRWELEDGRRCEGRQDFEIRGH